MAFEKNVFINCPFDRNYKPLLESILFCIIYLEFEPKISKTQSSANIRVEQIKKLILGSKYGIHDLSRCKAMKKNELPRFNMPFELGLDIGCLEFRKKLKKKILILETRKHHYKKVLSDIAGQNIADHNDKPRIVISKVRNWFSDLKNTNISGFNEIWTAYNQFGHDLFIILRKKKYTLSEIKNMPNSDYIKFAKDWIKQFKK